MPPTDGQSGTRPPVSTWLDELQPGAPDVVAAWRGVETDRVNEVRREVRRRMAAGSAESVAPQLALLAHALLAILEGLSEDDLRRDGGEDGWNVAQVIGHVGDARAGLCLAAARAASGRWPAEAPPVVPGVPGPHDADRTTLRRTIEQSQRIVERSARIVAGHETEACPLDHPLVGRLRCGEWILFAGIHDLMHLEQLHDLLDAGSPR